MVLGVIYGYSAIGHMKSEMKRTEYDSIDAAIADFYSVIALIPNDAFAELVVFGPYGSIDYKSGELPGGYVPTVADEDLGTSGAGEGGTATGEVAGGSGTTGQSGTGGTGFTEQDWLDAIAAKGGTGQAELYEPDVTPLGTSAIILGGAIVIGLVIFLFMRK
jgi:hypothetical protein